MANIGLKFRTKRAVDRFAARLPLDLLTWLVPRDVIVLMYHAVADTPAGYLRHLYHYKTPAQFEEDLICLKRHFSLPTWPAVAAREGEACSERRTRLLITFDDGLSDCFETVRPLLLKHNVPCMFFVTRDFVDNRSMFFRHKVSLCIERFDQLSPLDQKRILTSVEQDYANCPIETIAFAAWMLGLGYADQPTIDRVCALLDIDVAELLRRQQPYMSREHIEQLHADGFTIGGHSLTHPPLWLLSDQEVESQIVESCSFVRELLSAADVPFAFPFSANGVPRSLLRSVRNRNPWISAMFGSNDIDLDEFFLLNRINADVPKNGRSASNMLHQIKKCYAGALVNSLRRATLHS